MEALNRPLVWFYWYPHAYDTGRWQRAQRLGRHYHPTDDILLARRKASVFENRDYQPRIYTIDPDQPVTYWNDLNRDSIATQLRTLERIGADFIAVDCYAGFYNRVPYTEYAETMHIIAQEIQKTRLKFYTNMCLKLPRAILPISQPNYNEPYRDFDLTMDTLNMMVKFSAGFWDNPNYLKIEDKPVLGVYGLTAEKSHRLTMALPELVSRSMATWMKAEGSRIANGWPFMVGIVDVPLMTPILAQLGFDMVTTMAGLPNFFHNNLIPDKARDLMPEVVDDYQKYLELLNIRIQEWYSLAHTVLSRDNPSHFIPSLTLGFDARPRSDLKLPSGFVGYPSYPVIEEPTIQELEKAFQQIIIYLSTITHTLTFPFRYNHQPLVHIFAANEVGEGACVYPRVIDGKIDVGRFNAIGQMIASLKQMKI